MDKKLRVGIVDDEFLARQTLVNYINRYIENVEMVFEAADLPTAIEQIGISKPDAIFLDIEMPGPSGMEIAELLPENERPLVVFTTAYAQHAVDAFGMKAVDYLLKPIEVARLRDAVERLREQHKLSSPQSASLHVSTLNGSKVFQESEIVCLKADGSYTEIHTSNSGMHVISKKLFEIEEKLSKQDFLRVHRSYIVNMQHVNEYVGGNKSELILKTGGQVPVARTKKQNVISFLQEES
jgi:two-component system LytT family response regulator